MDLAHLGIKINYSDVDKAINKLKELEKTGAAVQKKVGNIKIKAKVDTATEKAKRNIKKIVESYRAADAAVNVLDADLHKLTMSYNKVATSTKTLINKIDLLSEKGKVSSSSLDTLNAQLRFLQKHAGMIGKWRNIEGLNFLLKTAEVRLERLQKIITQKTEAQKLDIIKPKTNAKLKETIREIKALNKQIAILKERSSVSGKQVEQLAARLSYLKSKALSQKFTTKQGDLPYIFKSAEKGIDILTKKIKKSNSTLKEWWTRFGQVGLGFTIIYQGINAITASMGALNNVIIEGIKQSGDLVATQSKLAMWLSFATKNSIGYSEAMKYAGKQTQALIDASLSSISTLDELSSALDEIGQAQVILSPSQMKNFANLVDFTKLVAQTTGSTTRQIRQELQALMQGELRVTNILIRTAKNLGILSEEDIHNLKNMQNRYEILTRLSAEISKYWEHTKKLILSADVATIFEKWQKSLVRIVSKSVQLTSLQKGSSNIFGETLYKHFEHLTQVINSLTGSEYAGGLSLLNSMFDKFLTLAENAVTGTLKFANGLDKLKNPLAIVAKALGGVAKDLGTIASTLTGDLLTGIDSLSGKIGGDSTDKLLKYAAEVALARWFLKGKMNNATLGAILAVLGIHVVKGLLQAPAGQKFGGLGWEKTNESTESKFFSGNKALTMMYDSILKTFNETKVRNALNAANSLKVPPELNKFAETVKDYIKTPLDKLHEYTAQLLKAQKYNLLTPEQVNKAKFAKMLELGLAGKSDLQDAFMLRDKGMANAAKRAAAIIKEQEQKKFEIQAKFAEEYKKLTLSKYDYERYLLKQKIEEYRKAGVDEIELSKYTVTKLKELAKQEAEERLRNSKYWKDGAIRALNEYAESAADVAKGMENVFTNAFSGLENTLVNFVTTGKAKFKDLINSIITDIARLTIRKTLLNPLAQALSAGLSSGLGAFFSASLSPTGVPATTTATPSAFSNLHLPTPTFGAGGVFLHSSSLSAYRNSIVTKPTLFAFASGMGLMGEAGPEAILPLTRTSSGDLGVKAETAPVEINIIDQRSANSSPVEVSETTTNGKKQITVLIKSEVESMIARGEFDNIFKQTYGLNRRGY